jgi:hypothetical protein
LLQNIELSIAENAIIHSSLASYLNSFLKKVNVDRYLFQAHFKNFPFCFVCLDKDIEGSTHKYKRTFDSTYLRTNPKVKKYFNALRMFRTVSIGADTIEPMTYIGNKETEYQQWGSTRYCFSNMGGIILSLSTDDEGTELTVNKKNMVYWFEDMYVPILVLNLYYRSFLMFYSKDLENQSDIHTNPESLIRNHRIFLNFMKEHWLYHISKNVQAEGIWESWKEALNASVLNKTLLLLTAVTIFFASISAATDGSPNSS